MKQKVVCAGDSITAGVVASNYVKMLGQHLPPAQFEFINGGVNGDLSHDLLQRIDRVIAHNPDIVTLLIGSNDINYRFDSSSWQRYQRKVSGVQFNSLTLNTFHQHYNEIIVRLKMAGVKQIALFSLPMQGEILDSPINRCVVEYNQAIRDLANLHELDYLPLYEGLAALLAANPHRPQQAYAYSYRLLLHCLVRHYFLRQSWNHIAFSNRLLVLTDHIHLNDLGASVLVELITCLLDKDDKMKR